MPEGKNESMIPNPESPQPDPKEKILQLVRLGVGKNGQIYADVDHKNIPAHKMNLIAALGDVIKMVALLEPKRIIEAGGNGGFRGRLGNFLGKKG